MTSGPEAPSASEAEPTPAAPSPRARIGLLLRTALVVSGAWLLLHGPRLPAAPGSDPLEVGETVVGVVLASLLLVVFTVVGWGLTREVGSPLRWSAPAAVYLPATAAVLGLGSLLDALVQGLGWGEGSAVGQIRDLLVDLPPPSRVLVAVVLGVFPGVTEEVFFRGWLLGRLRWVGGGVLAVAGSAVLFGLFHFDPVHAVLSGLIGLALGWIVLRFGGLGPAALAHGVNDAVGVGVAGLLPPALELGVGAVGGLALAVFGLVRLARLARSDPAAGAELASGTDCGRATDVAGGADVAGATDTARAPDHAEESDHAEGPDRARATPKGKVRGS